MTAVSVGEMTAIAVLEAATTGAQEEMTIATAEALAVMTVGRVEMISAAMTAVLEEMTSLSSPPTEGQRWSKKFIQENIRVKMCVSVMDVLGVDGGLRHFIHSKHY